MVDLTSNLVSEAKKTKVKYIAKQSVMGADAKPGITPEWLAQTSGENHRGIWNSIYILAPNFFMQNFVNYYSNLIRSQGIFYMPAGDAKVKLCYVESAVRSENLLSMTINKRKSIQHYRR